MPAGDYSALRQIIWRWKQRIRKGGNVNVILTGSPRLGKSVTMEGIAYIYNPERYSVSNVVWDIEPFVQRYNEARIGDSIRFDEAGVGVNSRDWFAKKSKQFVAIMQTMGFKNLLVMMTTPSFDYIDSQARKLFHWYIEVVERENNYVVLKVRELQYNAQTGKTYFKRPLVRNKDGTPYYMDVVKFYRPPQRIIDDYDKASETWKEKMGKDIQKLIKEAYREEVDEDEAVKTILAQPEYFTKKWGKKSIISQEVIENHFKIRLRAARRIKFAAEERLKKSLSQQV